MAHLLALALVVGAAVVAYANAGGGPLMFDARVLVAENPILGEASAANVGFALTHDYWAPMAVDGLYRPLAILSFLADRAVFGFGDRSTGYVVENVALHATIACLVYALVWTVARRRWPATVAGLLFAVHPVTTEAVTNVVGRADLLATLGVVAGLVAWARGRDATGGRRVGWAIGLGCAAVLALFSKESGVVLAGAVVLYDLVFPRSGARLRAEHLVVAAVVGGYLVARWYVDRTGLPPEDLSPVDNPIAEASFWIGRLTAAGVLLREAALLVWPATLSVDYSYRAVPLAGWPPASAGDWIALAGVVAIPVVGWWLVRARRRDPVVCFFGGLAVLAVLPSSNLLKVIGSIMAERFLYLPLVGVAALGAIVVDRAAGERRRTVAVVVVAAIVLAAAARTAARNLDWQDDRRLWATTVAAVSDSTKARKAYAVALFASSTDPNRLAEVVAQAERAVEIRPDYQPALVDLGSYCLSLGDAMAATNADAARRWWEKGVAALESARTLDERATARFVEKMRARGHAADEIPDVGDGVLYNNLSLVYVKLDRLEDALGAYRRMRELAPTNAAFYRDIATLEGALGQTDDAAVALFQAIDIADDAEAKERLVELYRGYPAAEPPIVTIGAGGDTQIHTSHPIVRAHRCRAWRELAGIFAKARLDILADKARSEAVACEE